MSFRNFAQLAVFASAIFVGALLMFLIEPMVAKMLLPAFGGSPNVWNTCVVFFQIVLLSGYLYAHLVSSHMSRVQQISLHLAVVWLPVFLLPIRALPGGMQIEHPFLSLLSSLAGMVGVLFFAISTTAPLLQKWYSQSDLVESSDPYFLYAASNAGGLIGLLAYPFLLEPNFSIAEQTSLVASAYTIYGLLITICTIVFLKNKSIEIDPAGFDSQPAAPHAVQQYKPDWRYCSRLLLYALVPASLTLGVTSYVTNDLSPMPFFWVVPLFLYLLSFVVAFARVPEVVTDVMRALAPPAVLVGLSIFMSETISDFIFGPEAAIRGVFVHLIALFLVSCACHSEIARQRPSPQGLTQYYLLVSLGGILGSSLNTFIAPSFFQPYLEYPIMLALAGILVLRPLPFVQPLFDKLAVRVTLIKHAPIDSIFLFVVSVLIVVSLSRFGVEKLLADLSKIGQAPDLQQILVESLVGIVPISFCLMISRTAQQLRAGIAVVAVAAIYSYSRVGPDTVLLSRNFFGSLSVMVDRSSEFCQMYHGSTMHGAESIDPSKRGEPITYYYADSPIGTVLSDFFGPPQTLKEFAAQHPGMIRIDDAEPVYAEPLRKLAPAADLPSAVKAGEGLRSATSLEPIGMIGLGTGTLAAYAKPHQVATYYEIDPQVIDVSSNPLYFTYLFQAKARQVDLRIFKGDGRLGIQKAPYGFYKVIVIDAFNSDYIPTHLLTREALQIYISKLKTDGILAFNVANRFYNLKRVLARASEELKIPAFNKFEWSGGEVGDSVERSIAEWVLFARDEKTIEMLRSKGWTEIINKRPTRLWTDDYCSPLIVMDSPFWWMR